MLLILLMLSRRRVSGWTTDSEVKKMIFKTEGARRTIWLLQACVSSQNRRLYIFRKVEF